MLEQFSRWIVHDLTRPKFIAISALVWGVPMWFLFVGLLNGFGGVVFAILVGVIAVSCGALSGVVLWALFMKPHVTRLRELAERKARAQSKVDVA
jgi:hypothetical protein